MESRKVYFTKLIDNSSNSSNSYWAFNWFLRSVAPSLSPASSEVSGWQLRDNQTQWVDAVIRVEKANTDNYAVGMGTALVLGVIFFGVAVILFRNRGGKKNRNDVQYYYTIHEDEK